MSAFRHHSYPGVYEDKDGRTCRVRYIDEHMIGLDGEYDQAILQEDMLQVLVKELPDHDSSRSKLTSSKTGQVYILGREVKDDGYVRTIEVSKQ